MKNFKQKFDYFCLVVFLIGGLIEQGILIYSIWNRQWVWAIEPALISLFAFYMAWKIQFELKKKT